MVAEREMEHTILVLSDSHGDVDSLKTVIKKFGARAGLVLHAGDGAEDLERLMATGVGLKPWEGVRGNSDRSSRYPPRKTVEFGGKRILLCHGHGQGVEFGLEGLVSQALADKADMAVYGHTHKPFWEEMDGVLVLNPGSLSRPRGRDSGSFATVRWRDGEWFDIRFYELAGIRRNRFVEFSPI
jgi:putative phosphoesterase